LSSSRSKRSNFNYRPPKGASLKRDWSPTSVRIRRNVVQANWRRHVREARPCPIALEVGSRLRDDSRSRRSALGGGTCSISIVLHHEPCRAVVQVDDAGNRILGRRAVYDRRPRRGVEHVQIVGGLLLARGQSAVPVVAAAVDRGGDME